MKRLVTLLTIYGYFINFSDAQNNIDNLNIEVRNHIAFLISHRVNLQGYALAHFAVTELSISKKTVGKKAWHRLFHYPEKGVCFVYTDLGKNKYTGAAIAILPYLQFPYLRTKHSNLNFKIGIGLSYVEKTFNRTTNYKDLVTGSHINAAIQLQQNYYVQITPHHAVSLGFGITHFSNGSFKLPNLGVNIATAGLSYRYSFKQNQHTLIDSVNIKNSYKFNIIASTGIKQVYPVQGKFYNFQTLSLQALHRLGQKNYLGIAADIFHDTSIRKQLQNDLDSTNNNAGIFQFGVALNYQIVLGKLTIPIQVGRYIYSNYKGNGNIYSRFGLQYQLSNHLLANFALKTHYAKADFFEYGLGYSF